MKETTSAVAGTATGEAKQVAATAGEQAGAVAGEAMEQVHQVSDEARAQVRNLASQAVEEARAQGDAQTERLADGMRGIASQLQALADGNPSDAGPLPDYGRQVAEQLQRVASRVGDGGVEGALDDVQRFARRKPGIFLLGAAAAGFFGGRALRSSKAASDVPAATPSAAPTPASAAPVDVEPQSTEVIDLDAAAAAGVDPAAAYADGVR